MARKAARPDTWMPLYWGDYLRDTGHLGATEHGAYLLLIGHYWTTGKPLPDDDVLLARIARTTPKEWKAARSILAPFFKQEQGVWRHKRIESELADWEQMREAKSKAGQASAAARAAAKEEQEGQQNANRCSTGVATEGPTKCNPSPSPKSSDTNVSGGQAADPIKMLFDSGVALLAGAGKSERQARALVGQWRKQVGDGRTAELIASAPSKTDPVAYIVAAIEKTVGDKPADPAKRFESIAKLVRDGTRTSRLSEHDVIEAVNAGAVTRDEAVAWGISARKLATPDELLDIPENLRRQEEAA